MSTSPSTQQHGANDGRGPDKGHGVSHGHGEGHGHGHGHGTDHGHGAGHAHGANHDHAHAVEGQAEILDLDAEVLAGQLAEITAWLPLASAPRHIVDLGSGTGTGTFALLARFPDARVTAVDASAEHLRRLSARAEASGLADRVRTVRADLDGEWPDLGAPDLVWASASMHHMADPDRALRKVRDLLTPGGLFAVVELAGFPRFLPPDAPAESPGLEDRLHADSDAFHAEHVPHRGADWGPMLTAAGFTIDAERTISIHLDRSHSDAVGRYALESLRLLRTTLGETLSRADSSALDSLLDPHGPGSIAHRDDLAVRTERMVWAARRE
ncbi:class I SAM-dependent methyltransferase [Nocardia jejuensis]|uniref:class I SAM-dependent methyltransferase n=1 Tax=Nocardia jejuensis TaxID=328049 RepID=UPI0009FE5738|nr:class I SAM-dependent methyltransferase [Nocardia jejuensis]